MLKSWSVPPISTSAFTFTESHPWMIGYWISCSAHEIALLKALLEVLPLQHLLDGHAAVQLDDVLKGHHFKPFTIEDGAVRFSGRGF